MLFTLSDVYIYTAGVKPHKHGSELLGGGLRSLCFYLFFCFRLLSLWLWDHKDEKEQQEKEQ